MGPGRSLGLLPQGKEEGPTGPDLAELLYLAIHAAAMPLVCCHRSHLRLIAVHPATTPDSPDSSISSCVLHCTVLPALARHCTHTCPSSIGLDSSARTRSGS